MTNSPESAPAETIDLTRRLEDLDDQRLAQLSDAELESVINQRRYLADLRQQEKWKKDKERLKRKTHYRRYGR